MWLPAVIEKRAAIGRFIVTAATKSSSPSAATFADTTVPLRSGSGPSTIASRRSNDKESHITAAITPIETIEYVMKMVAMTRVIGSSSCGKRMAAISKAEIS